MAESAESEVLAQGSTPRWSSRRRVIVAAAAVALAGGAIVADRRAQTVEASALNACTEQVEASLAVTSAPVFAMANYIRPVRDGAPLALQRDLDRLVSQPAARAVNGLSAAYDACRFGVWPHHRAVADRRDGCVEALDRATAYFRTVSETGGAVFRPDVELELRC
jgi:hypothetical protein